MTTDAAAAESANGRRRAALLRGKDEVSSALPAAAPLSLADVQALQANPTPEARAGLARRFGETYGQLAKESDQRLANAVLQLLVKDIASQVRQALAESVANSPDLPSSIAAKLANDDFDIARPILEHSPVLTDDDLMHVVRTNAMQYALAVAGRERLSENVTRALVDTGQDTVVVRLMANFSAKLSSETLGRVVNDYRGNSEVESRLVRRPELPFELVEQLIGVIGDRLEWDLVNQRKMSGDQAKWIAKETRERSALTLTARSHDESRTVEYWRERKLAGDLDHDKLLTMLRDGDVSAFEHAMAAMAEVPPKRVRSLLYDDDRRFLAALCLKCGFPTAHYIMVRIAIDMAAEALSPNPARHSWSSDAMRFMQEQYDKMRRDPARQEELLRQ